MGYFWEQSLGYLLEKSLGYFWEKSLNYVLEKEISYKETSLLQGDPLAKENQFYYEIRHKRSPSPWINYWKKLWRTCWIMPLFRGEFLLEESVVYFWERSLGYILEKYLGYLWEKSLNYP